MELYQSREVTQLVNEFGDEIELEMIQYNNHYYVIATICPDQFPFKDYIGRGKDPLSKRTAVKSALKELYMKAYPNLF